MDSKTLNNARRYLLRGIKHGSNKVSAVRALAAYKDPVTGQQLRRRDVFNLIREADFDIADATISTQFQRVRSGTLRIVREEA